MNSTDSPEGRDLSGVRVEQREAKWLQSVSVSGVAEVAPGHAVSLTLRSAGHHCNYSADGLHLSRPPAAAGAADFSLLWLSHDTGAVATTAQVLHL